jgi:hypothetical protein
MGRDGFGNLRDPAGLLALLLNRADGDVLAREVAWEEPLLGPLDSPPTTQDIQELRREHRVPIFSPFPLLDMDDHALAIDRGGSERNGLRDTKAGSIAGGQDGAMFPAPDAVQKRKNFLGAQDDGQLLGPLGCGDDFLEAPAFLERHVVQEAQGGNGDDDRAGRQFLFVCQIYLNMPDATYSGTCRLPDYADY